MTKKSLLLLMLLCFPSFSLNIEKSESKFFPQELGEKLVLFKSFETFWWGFVVTDIQNGHGVCEKLKNSNLFQRVECEQSPSDYKNIVADWARDLPLRSAPPTNLREKFLQSLGRASLPMPQELFSVLRVDPLSSYEDLINIFKSRMNLPFEREAGLFIDKETNRAIIPVQPNFSPDQSERLEPLKNELGQTAQFLGPHASTLENKSQITLDLKWVSILGMAVTAFYLILFILLKQIKLSLLLLPAFLGAALAAYTVDFIFGSVHGLTLAFGSGLIGLAVDFGMHAAFHPESKHVWKSNASAFITTLICLGVIAFSKIPLLRELMYFSTLGLIYAYLIYYLFRHQLAKYIVGRERNISLKGNKWTSLFSALLASGLILGVFLVKPAFDFKQFDFQDKNSKELSTWLYPKTIKVPPLFQVASNSIEAAIETSYEQMSWAKTKNINLETVGLYLPIKSARESNIQEWKKLLCEKQHLKALSLEEKTLFSPLLDNWGCENLFQLSNLSPTPEYIRSLANRNSYLTLWLPKTKEEAKEIRKDFPMAMPLSELTAVFSEILGNEVLWMLPLSLLLIVGYLLIYYKNIFLAFCAIVPFFIGCGVIAWAAILSSLPLSFMMLISIIMLLGLSVDYGVFAVDALWFSQSDIEVRKTATAMLLSSVTTVLGFLPLLGCKHQVLFQLGASLTFGILGTLIGTYYTIPSIMKWKGLK